MVWFVGFQVFHFNKIKAIMTLIFDLIHLMLLKRSLYHNLWYHCLIQISVKLNFTAFVSYLNI